MTHLYKRPLSSTNFIHQSATIKSVLLLLLLPIISSAQNPGLSASSSAKRLNDLPVQSLSIGDTLPTNQLSNLTNDTSSEIDLSSFKNKLLIIDFWATWCTSCIKNFPKLDSLKNQFPGQLEVILVNSASTGDTEQKIKTFFEKRRSPGGEKYNFPMLVGDTLLSKRFPHNILPHYVIINKGKIIAITAGEEITASNIASLLNGQQPSFSNKKDFISYDRSRPLFSSANAGEAPVLMRSSISAHIDGLPTSSSIGKDPNNNLTRITYINYPLLSLYRQAHNAFFPPNRTLLLVGDSTAFMTDQQTHWKQDNTWCYERIMPPADKAHFHKKMQQDLQAFFGYTATIEKHFIKTFLLCHDGIVRKSKTRQMTPSFNLENNGEPKYLHQQPLSKLVSYLNQHLQYPILDETNFTGLIDMHLPSDPNNFPELKQALSKSGFYLTETYREHDVFIISENSGLSSEKKESSNITTTPIPIPIGNKSQMPNL